MTDRENTAILFLVGFLIFTTLVQIVSFECFFSTSEITESRVNITSVVDVTKGQNIVPTTHHEVGGGAHEDKVAKPIVEKDPMKSPEEILTLAGVEMDEELKKSLPPLKGIIDMYGGEPIIIGTDRCEAFQKSVVPGESFIGPAGIFNTGTNLLAELLKKNCYIPDRVAKYGKMSPGIRDQVPWGKHNPVSYRMTHKTTTAKQVDASSFFPAVVIKDPYTWMDSMCRHHYEARWSHNSQHCPNLVPTTSREAMQLGSAETFKVRVKFNPTPKMYDSLVHLWSEWYQDWIDAEFPRLMVRFEDLVFHTESVITQTCHCAGGNMYPGPFKYIQDSAKGETQRVHKGGNGLVKSILKYGFPEKRTTSYEVKDLEYAEDHLKRSIMEMFHYSTPPR